MKIFYITTEDPTLQGDYQEVSTLIGLRTVYGNSIIDFPRKNVMYGDFSASPRDSLHGRGFTYFNRPIPDINRDIEITKDDIVLYGVVPPTYGVQRKLDLEEKARGVAFLDGHDDINFRADFIEKYPYFKRELNEFSYQNLFSTGFGIPSWMIRPIDLAAKDQLFQQTFPKRCFEENFHEQGRRHYIFDNEEDYYNDMSRSWFGLSCKKGGWDSLRHYEIIAAGALLLFKDFDKKPSTCSPQSDKFFGINFSSKEEALEIMNRLVVNNKPTDEYLYCLSAQRKALISHFTCEARAIKLYSDLLRYFYDSSR